MSKSNKKRDLSELSNLHRFYKLSRSAEKLQDNFERIALDENKAEDQVQKAQDKLMKLKMETQEASENYKKAIVNSKFIIDMKGRDQFLLETSLF